jgi:hypothetical protein
MTNGDPPADELSPAEQRLDEHLELLRANPPTAAPDLITRIVRTARWQAAVRDPLVLIGAVALSLGESIRLVFGAKERDQ